MIYSKYNFPSCPSNIICFTGDDISNDMIEKCFMIDNDFFEEKYLYNRERVKSWIKKYNEFCFVFYDLKKNEIIGYNFILLIDISAFKKYLNGEISYFTLGSSQFVNDKNNCDAALLYLSTAYSPNSKISLLMSMTQNAITDLIIDYKLKSNVNIKYYFLDAVCKFDEEYAMSMKLKPYKITAYGSKIFAERFNVESFFSKATNYNILKKIY